MKKGPGARLSSHAPLSSTWIEPLGALHLGMVLAHLLKDPWCDLGLHELLEIRLAVASLPHLRETDHG